MTITMTCVAPIFETIDPTPSLFENWGGAPGVRARVDHLYDLMGTEPEFGVADWMHNRVG
jgi:hemoglobin